jgi:signal transduction histidine kinase
MTRMLRRLIGSVRVRVTVTAILAVGCALGVSAAVLDAGLQHDRRRILQTTAEDLANNVVDYNPDLAPPLFLPRAANIDTGLVQVLRDSRVVGASGLLRNLPPLWSPGDPQDAADPEIVANLAPDVHQVAVPVVTSGIRGTVVVVVSLQQYDRTIAYLQRLLVDGAPILLVVVGIICWLVVGRALRPIELMRREVAEVADVSRGYRVAEPEGSDEVGKLARTLNSMLDRIHFLSERERRFVSDASHELRSPIANIRTELEVALHHPDSADWAQVADEVLDQNQRMEDLVSGLLLLSRSDEGSLPPAPAPVDVAEIVREVTSRALASAGADPFVAVTELAPVMVMVPKVYLERMVSNLVDNARRFASSGVSLTVALDGEWAVVKVRDDGPGVPEADRQRIFERFVRLDQARDRGEGGFGLGLAIVADLSRFYGGSIEAHGADPGAEFVLRLPAVVGVQPAPTPAELRTGV